MREVSRLPPDQAEALARDPFSYAPVGATRGTTYPPEFHLLRMSIEIGHGDDAFARAAETLLTWRMHAGAGLRVAASARRVEAGAVVRCRLGPLPIPCRVIWVVDEPGRRGFGYGTLPGHPEAGEEAFVVAVDGERVTLKVTAYSRPGLLLTRLAGPVGRLGQRFAVRRYAAALRR